MKNFASFIKQSSIVLLIAFVFSSCVKKDFTQPATSNVDPDLTANKTIADIKKGVINVPALIDSDVIISGVVIADDVSGNFYKTMIIQDSTGGIAVQIDISNFNTRFPIGRRVFIKCKGLYIADNGDGNYELGYIQENQIGRIPGALISQYVVAGKWGITVEPVTFTLSNPIPLSMSYMLVKIDSVKFQDDDTAKTYANATTLTSLNRVIEGCNGWNMNIYTSGYANFADSLTPTGSGSVIGIYTLYNSAGELQLRDTKGVSMTKPRC